MKESKRQELRGVRADRCARLDTIARIIERDRADLLVKTTEAMSKHTKADLLAAFPSVKVTMSKDEAVRVAAVAARSHSAEGKVLIERSWQVNRAQRVYANFIDRKCQNAPAWAPAWERAAVDEVNALYADMWLMTCDYIDDVNGGPEVDREALVRAVLAVCRDIGPDCRAGGAIGAIDNAITDLARSTFLRDAAQHLESWE